MTNIFTPINIEPENQANAESKKAERESKLALIQKQVEIGVDIEGTPAEKYLIEHRKLEAPFSKQSLRWAANYQAKQNGKFRSCLLFVVTNDKNEIVGLQSLELDIRTGAKACKTKPDKFSNGFVGEGFVALGTSEKSATLVIGEGVETTLTRNIVSDCDSYACLGSLRFIKPQKHHKRVEILADSDKRDKARQLARQYADMGYAAYVVTVPDYLGDKGDLNGLLQEGGIDAVRMAVEDAESISNKVRQGFSEFELEIGSDVEIAQLIIERLEEIYGNIVVSEGKIWRFDRTHWVAFDNDNFARFVHKADGAYYIDADGKTRVIRLNKNRINSIIDVVLKYRQQTDYFKNAPLGINCESGFIQIHNDGTVENLPHARKWRQRHIVQGKWHGKKPANYESSKLNAYVNQAFSGDSDASAKINLLGEVAGSVALGMGTRIKNPKAIITYSEEGGTGKSTFLRLLRALPNSDAVASVPAGKFSNEKYAYRLIGKVLNAVDELPADAIKSDVFKRIITGEPVPARDLYCSATDFIPIAIHVFSTNVLPSFSGGIDGGTQRRLLPIEFTHVVPENDRNPELPDIIIKEEADILLYFAVDGACRLIKQRDFTIPASSQTLLDSWLLSADPVRAWAKEKLELTDYENLVSVADLYRSFSFWARDNGIKSEALPNNLSFGKRLHNAKSGLEYHRSNGSHYRNVKILG